MTTEFKRLYGTERSYGEAIVKEQDLKEQVIKFQKDKEKYSNSESEQ